VERAVYRTSISRIVPGCARDQKKRDSSLIDAIQDVRGSLPRSNRRPIKNAGIGAGIKNHLLEDESRQSAGDGSSG
jgi:hypothetical protein